MTKSDRKEFIERLPDKAKEAESKQYLRTLYIVNQMLIKVSEVLMTP